MSKDQVFNYFVGSRMVDGSYCNAIDGQCHCRRNTQGDRCDQCVPGTYGLSGSDENGCKDCNCDIGGSIKKECNTVNGELIVCQIF